MIHNPTKLRMAVSFMPVTLTNIDSLINSLLEAKERLTNENLSQLNVLVPCHEPFITNTEVKEQLKDIIDLANHQAKYLQEDEFLISKLLDIFSKDINEDSPEALRDTMTYLVDNIPFKKDASANQRVLLDDLYFKFSK